MSGGAIEEQPLLQPLTGEFYYIDDDGCIQGAFKSHRMAKWFRKGYLRSELLMRLKTSHEKQASGTMVEMLAEAKQQAAKAEALVGETSSILEHIKGGEWIALKTSVRAVCGEEYACPFAGKLVRSNMKSHPRTISSNSHDHSRGPTKHLVEQVKSRSSPEIMGKPVASSGEHVDDEFRVNEDSSVEFESMRESVIKDAETKLKFKILLEQLQIALCKIDLESLHAIRHSLRKDNSTITQAVALVRDEASSASNGNIKESEIYDNLTQLLFSRLSSFEEMCMEISKLQRQATQLEDILSS